jgi:hypothetical protein
MSLNILHWSFIFLKSSAKPIAQMALEYYNKKIVNDNIQYCSISYTDEDYVLVSDILHENNI